MDQGGVLMRRRIALMLAACTLVGLGLTPSHAAAGFAVGVFEGTAHLPKFPCGTGKTCTGGTFKGTFVGRVNGKVGTFAMSSSYSYTEPDTLTSFCAVKGTANGTINIGPYSGTFAWTRTGLTAVVSFTVGGHSGKTLALFVPISTGFCQPLKPAAINATVEGNAATTN
jgi:hypothetical protein